MVRELQPRLVLSIQLHPGAFVSVSPVSSNMMWLKNLTLLFATFLITSASPLNETRPRSSCTVTSYTEVANAVASCTDITISGITVPAGEALAMTLQDGSTLTFDGYIKFDYSEWDGPLIHIKGNKLTVQGSSDHTLDGQGAKYWDGNGDSGKKKPKFFYIQATGGSVFKNINLLNCPKQCVAISDSDDLTLDYWTIDSSAGDELLVLQALIPNLQLGRNTDGFDLSKATNIVVSNSQVKNQDDCVCINQGSNMKFSNLWCYGGHGLSLAVGQDKVSSAGNIVSNIEFADSYVINSRNGIHIKTQPDAATGSITNVVYKKYSVIRMGGITYYGINVEEDYVGTGPTGNPVGNIPIVGLTMSGITGTMTGEHSVPVYILCGDGGCSDWSWDSISLTGNQQSSSCNYSPSGFSC
ncbi:hypothetical protein NQ317_003769 [Molorchus minor]|uniref:endo-polygalacturonase n=1 Tax=Molorchus minor TaxID=1323400 RepID=A0ABQ9J0Y4_9CUCU|nr:hypothetical protein NQ317_003769 [Molorchus minor]